MRGIVDSQDLSLNISREMLQHDSQLRLIRTTLERKIKNELAAWLKNDREQYEAFFKNFGLQLKVGCYEGYGVHKNELQDLLLFHSAKQNKLVTLREYVDAMAEGQKYIYYAAGESVEKLGKLPVAETVLDKGFDILYLTQDVDEFVLQMLREYDKKEFRNISGDDLGLETDEEKEELKAANEAHKDLFAALLKEALGDKVAEVKLSQRLKSHPVCLSSSGAAVHRDGKGAQQHAGRRGERQSGQPQSAGAERRAPRVPGAGAGAGGRRQGKARRLCGAFVRPGAADRGPAH